MSKPKTKAFSLKKKAHTNQVLKQSPSGIVKPSAQKLRNEKRQVSITRHPQASGVGPEGVQQLARSFTGILGESASFSTAFKIAHPDTIGAIFGLDKDATSLGMHDAFAEFVREMAPRDPLEKLALEQLLLNHIRVLRLSQQASSGSSPEMIKILNEAADHASGSFRRLMVAFGEYRKKPSQQSIVAIAQANVAHQQQIVQHVDGEHKKIANELGSTSKEARLRALRTAIRRNRPWNRSTGPKTPAGKNCSAKNSLKHGLRSAKAIEMARQARTIIHLMRGG